MNLDKIKSAIEIAKLIDDDACEQPVGVGRPVIVRARDAGVVYGNYVSNDGSTVRIENAVQMWRWKAAKGGTLLDCAEYGVDGDGCKFSHSKGSLTVFNACALIDVSSDAAASIEAIDGGDWS